MSNESLLIYAARNDTQAVRELLTREIMAVDNLSWEVAHEKIEEIDKINSKGMIFAYMPYKIGVIASLTAGLVSIPLTYHLDTVLWFNEHFVTSDVAEDR
jgi:hypothetical protein